MPLPSSFTNELSPQYAVRSLSGDPPDDLALCVYLYGKTEPQLKLPLVQAENESLEHCARRQMKAFGEILIKASGSASINCDDVDFWFNG